MSKKLNLEQIEQVIEKYKNGESAKTISKSFGISPPSIYGLLKRRNIDRRTYSETSRKYSLNETYFDDIDCQEKAYFLGFLYADGYNNEARGVVELSCSEKDREILEKFSKLINSTKPVRFVESNGVRSVRIDLCSRKLCSALSSFGCVQTKTFKIKFPLLNENLISHFIRGYFDGDGCLSYGTTPKDNVFGNAFNSVITFVSTEDFCNSIKDIIKNKLDINSTLLCRHPSHNNNNRTLQISGNLQVVRMMQWMYEKSSICLDRKMAKFIELQNELKERKVKLENFNKIDLIKVGKIIKNDVERWNARYWITRNEVPHEGNSYFTEDQASILRNKLNEYGDNSAIPQEEIDRIFDIYRKTGFPYYHYENGYMVKRLKSLIYYEPKTDGGLLKWDGFCTELASYFHPQMFNCRKKDKMSPIEFFNSDIDFKRGIKKIIALYPKIAESNIREICSNEDAASRINNFPPRVAMAILKTLYRGQRITVLDPCSGFSGRLLGCFGSGVVKKYIGIDLSKETIDGLNKTSNWLKESALDEELLPFSQFETNIINGSCIEVMKTIQEDIDCVFTSPPFLDEEEYVGVEVERSYDKWREIFIYPFITETYKALKVGGKLVVYTEAFRRNDFPVDFAEKAKEVGYTKCDDICFKMPSRETLRKANAFRVVKIMVFQK